MKQKILLPSVNFGQPEAEHDLEAIRNSFYEGDSWRRVISNHRLPFVVGRKGSGKSAVAARLVDTKSVEYDKLESLVINLQWNSRSLFELVAKRVAPGRKEEQASYELRALLS